MTKADDEKTREAEKLRGKHVGVARGIAKMARDEFGDVADGGPPVFVARPDLWGPGLTKPIDELEDGDEALGEITGIQLHIAHTPKKAADPE